MKPKFLGDSYDIVKQSLLRWLASMGPWATHPMFTDAVSSEEVDAYAFLLGTRVLSREVLTPDVDRDAYLAPARDCDDHVFLDPDIGIQLKRIPGKKAPAYVFGAELVAIARARPERLTLVFDQSLARGEEQKRQRQLECKLFRFTKQGICGVAYFSHACFVLLGTDSSLVERALENLKRESRLPDSRFLKGVLQNKAAQQTASGGR